MIKIIIQNFVTKTDTSGNRYWKSNITNTRTGKSLTFETPHSSNTYGIVRNAGYEWDEILEVAACDDMRAKNFKWIKTADVYKDTDIIKAIKQLNRKEATK